MREVLRDVLGVARQPSSRRTVAGTDERIENGGVMRVLQRHVSGVDLNVEHIDIAVAMDLSMTRFLKDIHNAIRIAGLGLRLVGGDSRRYDGERQEKSESSS